MTTDRTAHGDRAGTKRTRRRHPAAGGRIIAGALSAAAALALMGAMAHGATGNAEATTTPTAPTSASQAVIVLRRASGTPSALAAPLTPRVAPTAAVPVTTSQAS